MAFILNIFFRFTFFCFTPHITALRPPVFVVGGEHSGTTILSFLLSSFNETQHVPFAFLESSLFHSDDARIAATLNAWDQATLEEGKRMWVEKTPDHVTKVDKILRFRPNARFVVAFRNAVDVVASVMLRGFPFSEALRRWIDLNRAALSVLERLPDQSMAICYEDLADFRDHVIANACQFMEIDRCVSFEELDEARKAAGRSLTRELAEDFANPANVAHENNDMRRWWQMVQPFEPSIGDGYKVLSHTQLVQVQFAERQLPWHLLHCSYGDPAVLRLQQVLRPVDGVPDGGQQIRLSFFTAVESHASAAPLALIWSAMRKWYPRAMLFVYAHGPVHDNLEQQKHICQMVGRCRFEHFTTQEILFEFYPDHYLHINGEQGFHELFRMHHDVSHRAVTPLVVLLPSNCLVRRRFPSHLLRECLRNTDAGVCSKVLDDNTFSADFQAAIRAENPQANAEHFGFNCGSVWKPSHGADAFTSRYSNVAHHSDCTYPDVCLSGSFYAAGHTIHPLQHVGFDDERHVVGQIDEHLQREWLPLPRGLLPLYDEMKELLGV